MKTETKGERLRADRRIQRGLPEWIKLVHTLRGHKNYVGRLAWSHDGRLLASPSGDGSIRLWHAQSGDCLHILQGHTGSVHCAAFDATSNQLASGGLDLSIKLWDTTNGALVRSMQGDPEWINSIAFDPKGTRLASAGFGSSVRLWDSRTGEMITSLDVGAERVWSLAFDPSGRMIAVADSGIAADGKKGSLSIWNLAEKTKYGWNEGEYLSVAYHPRERMLAAARSAVVEIWQLAPFRLLRTLEGHTKQVSSISFSGDGRILASKGNDSTIQFWAGDTGSRLAAISEPSTELSIPPGVAFHPNLPLLASAGSDPDTHPDLNGSVFGRTNRDRLIHIWQLDFEALLNERPDSAAHYVNAKVVLVGDTGVGKSGLSLVLNNQRFLPTDSTPGRRVWTLKSQQVTVPGGDTQTRETLLWDLAGQPGYRIIHQLHLHEIAIALVVFDARSETDPLAGVRHWERALRLAQQRQGSTTHQMKKFLVSARNDRGGVSIGDDRIESILNEFGFDKYFKTSAKEGWQINELRDAIERAIDWDFLPEVSSSKLFSDIKLFLLDVKKSGRLLAPGIQLYDEFAHNNETLVAQVADLRDQFNTCIGRLENRDLIRRLTFGGYVLLQPELLDAYGSAMVNTAKEEPDGLGSIEEDIARTGRFFVPKEQRVTDTSQEQILLHATVEELVQHDLALRENADDGRYLVFPSQFNRDYEEAPEPKGKALAITFDGPVQSLYSTLVVRLGHSGLFSTRRAEMWRNAAVFTSKLGGKCGLFLHEFAEARGRLILFFPDDRSTAETRFHFEEFALAHTIRRSIDRAVEVVRFFVCSRCGEPVPDAYVKILQNKGALIFQCPCGGEVPLSEPIERIQFASQVGSMERTADRHREFDAFVMSANGETRTKSFLDWAGGERVTLAIVFTDIVDSTALGEAIRDEAMDQVRRSHFARSRDLIRKFKGREIKTIGDSFMSAFRSVDAALDYALSLNERTGHPQVHLRAGIHIGSMQVEENDVFGGTVNFAARVVGAVEGAEIWMSERAREDIERLGARNHKNLRWKRHDGIPLKGFPGTFILWAVGPRG